jgi:hypothetical protein
MKLTADFERQSVEHGHVTGEPYEGIDTLEEVRREVVSLNSRNGNAFDNVTLVYVTFVGGTHQILIGVEGRRNRDKQDQQKQGHWLQLGTLETRRETIDNTVFKRIDAWL